MRARKALVTIRNVLSTREDSVDVCTRLNSPRAHSRKVAAQFRWSLQHLQPRVHHSAVKAGAKINWQAVTLARLSGNSQIASQAHHHQMIWNLNIQYISIVLVQPWFSWVCTTRCKHGETTHGSLLFKYETKEVFSLRKRQLLWNLNSRPTYCMLLCSVFH